MLKIFLICTVLLCFISIGCCQQNFTTPLVVGFVYNSPPTDFSWNFQIDLARLQLVETFGRELVKTFYEVSFDDARVASSVNLLVAKGARLIFVSSNDSKFSFKSIAVQHPTVKFVITNGDGVGNNVNIVYLRNWQCFNMMGTIAGLTSKTGRGGLVLPFRNTDTYRVVNSFYLGARTANPNFKLDLYYTANQDVVARTRKSIELFSASGVDVAMGYLTDFAYYEEAVKRGMYTFSFPNAFAPVLYGDLILTGCIIDWNVAVTYYVNQTLNGKWYPYGMLYGAAEGGIKLAPISPLVSDQDAADLLDVFSRFKNGTIPCTFNSNELLEKGLLPSSVNVSLNFDSTGCTTSYGILYMNYLLNGIVDKGDMTDDIVYSAVFVENSSGSAITLYTVVSVTNFLIIIALVVVFIFRKRVIIAVTNEYFCYSILLGSMIGYSSIYLWLGQPNDAKCLARIWFLSIACVLIFGAIASKTYRIWRLWTNPDIKETQRSGSVIGLVVASIGFIQLALLIVLTALQGYHQDKVSSSELAFDKYYDTCVLDGSGIIIVALLLAVNGVVVVACAILAYASKSVSEKYNETTSIVLSIYSIIVSVIVVILLFVNIKTQDPTRQLTFIASGVFIAITCPLLSIFLPKFKVIITEYSGGSSPGSSASASHSTSSQKLSGRGSNYQPPV